MKLCPFLNPIYNPSTSAFLGFGPDKVSLIISAKAVLIFMIVRKLDIEWLMICQFGIIFSVYVSKVGSCFMSRDF